MKPVRAAFAGVLGALAMSLVMFLFRLGGVNVSLEALLGSMFDELVPVPAWVSGFVVHLLIGAIVGLVYALIFEVVGTSGALVGAGVGLAHGLMAALIMSGIPAMNPPNQYETAPGAFLSNLSYGPAIFLLLHVVFGITAGLAYGSVRRKHAVPKEVAQPR